MRRISSLLVLSLLPVLPASLGAAEPAGRPNVLFIAVDDLNDWIGCLDGHPQAHTPNLDRLAARGTLFTNAHASAPLCNPSRASVMTGLLPSTSGVHGNQQDWRESPYVKGHPTLGETFRRQGYFTGAAGKIFHANHGAEAQVDNGGHGGLRGFHHPASWTERFPSKDRQLAPPAVMTGRNLNGLDIWHWDWGAIDVPVSRTTDGQSVAWIEKQLEREHDQPFFLACGIYRPHGPWYVPPEFFDLVPPVEEILLPEVLEDDVSDVPAAALGYLQKTRHLHRRIVERGQWREAIRAYLACIAFADAQVGRLLDALDRSPHAANTVVCLWSDHGWHLGEKQRWHKSTNWERATRVPLIISAPGLGRPGQRSHRAVSLVDLYPTLVELAGLEAPENLDGESLVPFLRDPRAMRSRPAITTRAGRHHSVRDDRWRYTRYGDGSEELYDHRSDPHEWHNLAASPEHREVRERLARHLPAVVRRVEEPSAAHREPGFRPLFNGHDLTGWDGDPERWRVENGEIVGESRPGEPLVKNTYLIWRGGRVGDFDLRLEFQLPSGHAEANSGIQYRSVELPDEGPWVLGGYQADIDRAGRYLGRLHDERGRGTLAIQGHGIEKGEGPEKGQDARPGHPVLRPGEWNDYRIVAHGSRLIHEVNGVRTVAYVEGDGGAGRRSGLLGLQLHFGPPTVVRFRNIRFKEYGPVEDRPVPAQPFRPRSDFLNR